MEVLFRDKEDHITTMKGKNNQKYIHGILAKLLVKKLKKNRVKVRSQGIHNYHNCLQYPC
jgi:hypothetical protein